MRHLTLLPALLLFALPAPGPAQDLPESSPEAIAAHAEGLRLYLANDYRAAIPQFLRAHELDPTFYVPLFSAAINAGNAGMTTLADSLWDVVASNRAHFSDYYQRLIDIYVMRRTGGDWAKSMDMTRSVAKDYPGTKAAYNFALWSNSDGKPREALAALATLDPDKEPMKGWIGYYEVQCNALHWIGDAQGELQCAQDAARRFPDRGAAHFLVAEALAAQGRGTQAVAAMQDALARPEVLVGYSAGNMLGILSLELFAHECGEGLADEQMDKALAWYDALPPDRARNITMRRQHAYWLYAGGEHQKAYQAYQGIVDEFGSVTDRGLLGITAGLAGDRPKAMEIRDWFLSSEADLLPEVQHYWAARIAAGLDDREGAAAHFKKTWSLFGSHLEPVLVHKMGDHPAFRDYIKPRG